MASMASEAAFLLGAEKVKAESDAGQDAEDHPAVHGHHVYHVDHVSQAVDKVVNK